MAARFVALLTAVLAMIAIPASAQSDYPNQPVRIVIGFAPGGGTDTIARRLADHLGKTLGQQFVVDNRTGGAGAIAASYAANARPDGYTIYFSGTTTLVLPVMVEDAGFDPIESFTPIANINRTPMALVAHPDFEASTVEELVELAKAAPGEYFYGTPGVGSTMHLMMVMVESQTGIELVDTPYQGASPSLAAVVSGEVPLAVISLAAAIEQERGGAIKIIASSATERMDEFPEIPVFSESIEGFSALPGNFLVAPAGTPQEIVEKLSDAVDVALQDEEFRNFLSQQGLVPSFESAAELGENMPVETRAWTEAAETAKARAEN